MTTQMALEVAEIPAAAQRFLDASADQRATAAAALQQRDPQILLTVARGSSDHAATYLKYAAELLTGRPVASIGPSVASIYGRSMSLGSAACIGISQSGQSPDIVQMMQTAHQGGAVTLAITNHADSPMGRGASHCLPLHAGEEKAVAATKTFINSVLAGLCLLADWQEDAALQQALAEAPKAMTKALTLDWSPLAARLSRAQSAFVLGRGPSIGIAAEAALKMKETCGLHAEAYSAAEVLHGPSAIVQAGFPVLALATEDEARPHVVTTAERLSAQGADVFLTGDSLKDVTPLPMVTGLHPLVAPLVMATSFYAFVETLSRRRGLDPDRPPHLRKVTETL
ncbi:SIS domain-containing protein [Xinfangfangia sp. CPCC 101601]|uniref:SIS domain-containing protein n=1 Tax=Pseudogemmobacter lacusdianii TaxID=3069608 RepID=A0ABU0VU62_9RHOB|nr:SIS domain-containing protein [Xinfangfangia sp. CPCC 101601]MDQ2065271.1 SIS domain-containing protein [Xinfangfangia sp. CPCC 101601]